MPRILLMGRAGVGKSSMIEVIFFGMPARDTIRLKQTRWIRHLQLKFLGNLLLDLWDCGGCVDASNTTEMSAEDALIYVVTADEDKDITMNKAFNALDTFVQSSPDARVFCLVNKLDLLRQSERQKVFESYEAELRDAMPIFRNATFFATSIFDETLVKAWSEIMKSLIPHSDQLLMSHLQHVRLSCEAQEVIIFEHRTFLVVSSTGRSELDPEKISKISNAVKQFKLMSSKVQGPSSKSKVQGHEDKERGFKSFRVKNPLFSATIEPLLKHSFVMVVHDPKMHSGALAANLEVARSRFAELAEKGAPWFVHL